MAVETRGAPVPWVTGLGATETAPFACARARCCSTTRMSACRRRAWSSRPCRSTGGSKRACAGPNITPGYWRNESQTRDGVRRGGLLRTGDVIAPRDPADLTQGFVFQGRLTEDFKLSTGTWVRVGSLRARLLAALGQVAAGRGDRGADRATSAR